jgi:hypothetical protein
MIVEVSYVEWGPNGLLRHVVYLSEHEDNLASEVRHGWPSLPRLDPKAGPSIFIDQSVSGI